METTICIKGNVYSVGSDEELEELKTAVTRLEYERTKQKSEREQETQHVLETIADFIENYGQVIISNGTAEIYIDAENIDEVCIGWKGEDD